MRPLYSLLTPLLVGTLASFAAAEAKADLLSDIKGRGEIVVATEARYAPFEMIEDGKIVGYGKDLLDAIMLDLPGVKLKQLDVPFQGILPGLSSKRFDFVATSLTITKARAESFAFTLPFSTASVAVLKRKGDARINSAEDLIGMVVGSQAGAPQIDVLKEYERTVLQPTKNSGVKEIKAFMDYNEAYAALASRRVDAVVQSLPNLAPLIKERGDVFEIVQPPFGPPTYYAWAGRKDADSASLVKFFSDGIAKLNASGELAKLQRKWFGFEMPLPTDAVPAPIN
ncbi:MULTISPECIES: transporter substrate-binding domain-containing protein [Pseudomonas]|jgi:polar amino acid transport system substrate-binding protein|uniref:Polar amino acid transport system substrate-binding protein n=3 Tax=Pseudomonas TaxID=286 RepID=A0A5C5QAF7_9PSED|nr:MULTISPECIES: transporter substrate-binding domain-containing protein [Pseudomonas]HCE9343921.1 transporter substrate-binding domain-containing protein [Pseudomonas aeruginosa]EZI27819.1 ABC transporter substrate-binding protein [Pseudomonas extremaustralis 14-3 substr. 14-3b]MBJ2281410.1 transporter substrate-binding domain-containing protein [Pseudomonas sp. MF6767]MDW8841004.1 transporter substrate-binding domain-containing protein [Pseudomonas carnis]NMX44264.1 transporter substrate-bin